jgi:hypothetical protein
MDLTRRLRAPWTVGLFLKTAYGDYRAESKRGLRSSKGAGTIGRVQVG